MSTSPDPAAVSTSDDAGHARADVEGGRDSWWAGRSGLVIPLIMAAVATWLAVGNLTMAAPDDEFPGPTFVPWILVVAGYVLAALLVLQVLRHPRVPEHTHGHGRRTYTDWGAVAWCVGGFALFAATLDLLGWILGAAVLFWCVARGIGSTRPVFDASLALVVSSLVYLAFSVGLGLTLPSGLLGGGW